jgi:hypothetical protein
LGDTPGGQGTEMAALTRRRGVACTAARGLMRRHFRGWAPGRHCSPPAHANAQSGIVDEISLHTTELRHFTIATITRNFTTNSTKWPPLFPETLRGRSPVSDAVWRDDMGDLGLIVGRGTQRNACQEGERRAVLARPAQPEEHLQPQGMSS